MALAIFVVVCLTLYGQLSYAVPIEETKGVSERIVGGVDAERGYAPHMVALVFGQAIVSLTCGGSVVSKRHVLTAAHCITSFITWEGNLLESFGAVVGSNQWNSINNLVAFEHFVNHPDYDSWLIKNDVGVLFLAKELQFNKKVSPMSLSFDYVKGSVSSYVTGWGTLWAWGPIPDNLQKIYLNTISGRECDERMAAQQGWAPPIDHHVEICTHHSHGHGMCHGDSGSALVDRRTGKQIGIVSWGFPCAQGAPDVYARISGFVEFLKPILEHC